MKKTLWSFFEIFETIIIAFVAVVLIRAFVAQPFLVSGSSMEPSFSNGDYLLVDELVYRFREPKRGEVIIFRNPSDGNTFYIKRIIGLPTEEVILDGEKVIIERDGKSIPLKEDYITNTRREDYKKFKLGPNEYFVMGDNRGFSYDSRSWGVLRKDSIIGLARLRLWPISRAMAISTPSY